MNSSGKSILFEFITLECRWFFSKPVPVSIKQIFEDIPVEKRTDIYWIKVLKENLGSTEQGMKLREGRLEVKQRLNEINDPLLPGIIQKWKKTGELIPENINLGQDWMEIPKKRQLIKYELVKGYLKGPVQSYPASGCNMELTTFGKPFEDHWTFGFEAYGKSQDLMKLLHLLYELVQEPIISSQIFSTKNSKSYPEWIQSVYKIRKL